MGWDWYFKAETAQAGERHQGAEQEVRADVVGQQVAGRAGAAGRSGRLSRGRSYARSGQVLNLDIKPGRIESRVQGSAPRPYKVKIEIKPLSEKEWKRVADAMAAAGDLCGEAAGR